MKKKTSNTVTTDKSVNVSLLKYWAKIVGGDNYWSPKWQIKRSELRKALASPHGTVQLYRMLQDYSNGKLVNVLCGKGSFIPVDAFKTKDAVVIGCQTFTGKDRLAILKWVKG